MFLSVEVLWGGIALATTGAGAALVALVRSRRALAAERLRSRELATGVVFRAEETTIIDMSEGARALPGAEAGGCLERFLGAMLGEGREEALRALGDLVRHGRGLHLLVHDRDGRPWELIGNPRGGEVVVELRNAALMVAQLRKAEARIAARERTLAAGWYERRTISSLIESGSAIAWHRASDGRVIWSAGHVATAEGRVSAEQAVALVRARPATDDDPAARPVERSRIEILPSGALEPLPLQVIETRQPDGTRTGIATDASVAANAERALGRFVQTMTETFAQLTIGLAIFDRNQSLALFNPALANMLQLDPGWLANRPTLRDMIDLLRSNRRIPETGDFHAWRARMLALFDNPDRADYDEVWHLADGSNIDVIARPHPQGSLAFVFHDISERLSLERSYRQSIDLRRATLNRLDEGLAVFGTNGLLQFVNDAFHGIWGTEPTTLRAGMHAREVMQLCHGLTLETEIWQRIVGFITSDGTREAWSGRVTLGSSRTLSARVAPLPGGASMIVFADITDSERIARALSERNEALEAAEEMRTAVLDQISHRLRTPLNTIFGFGQLLTDPRFGQLSDRQRSYAAGILEASGQLLDTIDDVTDLASLQLEASRDEGRDPPLAETLELTRSLLAKRAAEAGVSLSATLPDGWLRVRCDGIRLRQIVFNMAAGAVQRSPAGSHVVLSARPVAGGRIEIHAAEHRSRPVEPEVSGAEAGGAEAGGAEAGGAEAGALAVSVTRRMAEEEGGILEQRAGDGPNEVLTVCTFEAAEDASEVPPEQRRALPR